MVGPISGTVLIPAYKEEDTIEGAIETICATLERRVSHITWDIVVVNDGSPDQTGPAAIRAAAKAPLPVRVLEHVTNQGLGGALRTGLSQSAGDVVIVMDCDLTYPASTIVDLAQAWERTRAAIVIASPYMPGGEAVAVPKALERRSRIANSILGASSTAALHTLTGMVRAYEGDFIRNLPLKAVGPDINVEIIYKAEAVRANVIEIPAVLDWTGREARSGRNALVSKNSRWTTAKSLVMSYLFRPFMLPLVLSGAAGVAAVIALALRRGPVALTMLGFALVLLMQALAMLQAKRYFEETFNQLGALVAHRRPAGAHPYTEWNNQDTMRENSTYRQAAS